MDSDERETAKGMSASARHSSAAESKIRQLNRRSRRRRKRETMSELVDWIVKWREGTLGCLPRRSQVRIRRGLRFIKDPSSIHLQQHHHHYIVGQQESRSIPPVTAPLLRFHEMMWRAGGDLITSQSDVADVEGMFCPRQTITLMGCCWWWLKNERGNYSNLTLTIQRLIRTCPGNLNLNLIGNLKCKLIAFFFFFCGMVGLLYSPKFGRRHSECTPPVCLFNFNHPPTQHNTTSAMKRVDFLCHPLIQHTISSRGGGGGRDRGQRLWSEDGVLCRNYLMIMRVALPIWQ